MTTNEALFSLPDAVILCGGSATRLGGIDKPLRALAGTPLIERVVNRIQPQCRRILLSANRNLRAYENYGAVVVDDPSLPSAGPLAGIAAGLTASTSPWTLCVPGDAPNLPLELVRRLAESVTTSQLDIAFVDDGLGPQPLCALIRTGLRDELIAHLRAGGSTPRHWYQQYTSLAVTFGDWPRWSWSVNTPEEWARAEIELSHCV